MLRALFASLLARPAAVSTTDSVAETSIDAAIERALRSLVGLGNAKDQPADYERMARLVATVESAQYMVECMQSGVNVVDRAALLEYSLQQATIHGLVLEFGVYQGASLRFLAQRTSTLVHGFDSFEGLPEDWTHFQRRGRFSLSGNTPHFEEQNIRIHRGLFGDTLEPFLAQNEGPVRLLHIDCDLYSSTRDVLEMLARRIVPGTLIVFDEYINFPGWRLHEYRAFQEFVLRHKVVYRYAAFASAYMSVAVRIESNPSGSEMS